MIKTVTNIYLGGECYFPDVSGKKFTMKKGHYYCPNSKNFYTHEISDMGQYLDGTYKPGALTAIKCFTYNNEVLVLGTSITFDHTFYGAWATRLDNVVWETGGVLRRLYTGLKHLLAPRKVVLV